MSEFLYTCEDCGEPTNDKHIIPTTYGKDLITHRCKKCKEKLHAKIHWQNEQFRYEDIVCPWCDNEFSDYEEKTQIVENPYEVQEGVIVTCPACGERFELEIEVRTMYTTRKLDEDFDYEKYKKEHYNDLT